MVCAAALLLLVPGTASAAPVLSTEVPAGTAVKQPLANAGAEREDGGRLGRRLARTAARLRRRRPLLARRAALPGPPVRRVGPRRRPRRAAAGGAGPAARGAARDVPDRPGAAGEPARRVRAARARAARVQHELRRPRGRRPGGPERAAAGGDERRPVRPRAHDDDARGRRRRGARCSCCSTPAATRASRSTCRSAPGSRRTRADKALLLVENRGWIADLHSGAVVELPAGSVATNAARLGERDRGARLARRCSATCRRWPRRPGWPTRAPTG